MDNKIIKLKLSCRIGTVIVVFTISCLSYICVQCVSECD